jgi:acyl carrier protein
MFTSEEFVSYIAHAIGLTPPVTLDSDLVVDLGFDSLMTYELLVAVEDLGVEVSEDEWLDAVTVRDCFTIYCNSEFHGS